MGQKREGGHKAQHKLQIFWDSLIWLKEFQGLFAAFFGSFWGLLPHLQWIFFACKVSVNACLESLNFSGKLCKCLEVVCYLYFLCLAPRVYRRSLYYCVKLKQLTIGGNLEDFMEDYVLIILVVHDQLPMTGLNHPQALKGILAKQLIKYNCFMLEIKKKT